MHRTEGPDYITESGKRRYKETPSPGTVVNKFHMNAIQEEIALVIEGVGMTLAATGAADRSAGWGQLYQAIRRSLLVDITAHGADNTGVADSTSAINSALAQTGAIYVPAGVFRVDGALTLPNNGLILGEGLHSIFNFNTTASKMKITNQNFIFQNFLIQDGGSSPDQSGIEIDFSADKLVILENLIIGGMLTNLSMQASTIQQGTVLGRNITLAPTKAGGTNLKINNTGGTKYPCTFINISPLRSIQNAADINLELNGDSTNGGGIVTIDQSFIYNGSIDFNEKTAQMFIINSRMDVAEYNFAATDGGGFTDCVIGSVLANTVNNNITAASRTFWRNVRDEDGTIKSADNTLGILTKRRLTTPINILASALATVLFNVEDSLIMARNSAFTKDTVYSAGVFTCKGYGTGRVKIRVQVDVAITDFAAYPPAASWQFIYVYISWAGTNIYLPAINPGSLSGGDTIMYGAYTEIELNKTDTFEIIVANFLGGGGTDDITVDAADITVQGL